MFIVNWMKERVNDIMGWLGLLPENSKILFLGLDNAGKTTLLHMLRDDRMTTHNPTLHPHAEELYIGNRRFRAFDLGGHEAARRIWKDYYSDVDAIIFLVDAADRTRMPEAKNELHALFENEALRLVPFAILGNKIDIPTACGEDELRNCLQLPSVSSYGYNQGNQSGGAYRQGGGQVEVFMCTLVNKMGYGNAFKWISDCLKNQQK
jgi:GTP-binding protein SAR1